MHRASALVTRLEQLHEEAGGPQESELARERLDDGLLLVHRLDVRWRLPIRGVPIAGPGRRLNGAPFGRSRPSCRRRRGQWP